MATLKGTSKQQTFSVSKFLGLYEAEDGDTQMKRGVSPSMNNYEVTENFHLRTRSGFSPLLEQRNQDGSMIPCKGVFADGESLYVMFGADAYLYKKGANGYSKTKLGTLPYTGDTPPEVTMFRFAKSVYFLNGCSYYGVERRVGQPKLSEVVPYVPTVVTGASPSGGGTELERVNMLTSERKALFSADGTSKEYLLPEYNLPSNPFVTVEINGADVPTAYYKVLDVEGSAPRQTKVVFLQEAPAKGVNNVEISWKASSDSKALISAMRYVEKFNGATDSRLFFYGDGKNVVYYTEPTLSGELTGAYIPAMNEIAFGDDTSPVTGLMRHYGRMMAFKPDGTYSVSYDTITKPDGSVTAGFYVRTMHRSLGSDCMGQMAYVQNFPRTFCAGTLYDWKQTASYYQDERYARSVSEPVQFTLRKADAERLVFFDDDVEKRFYLFLNDSAGTVLVNAYEQGVWYRYSMNFGADNSTARVVGCCRFDGMLLVATEAALYELDERFGYDYTPSIGEQAYLGTPILSRWESGFDAFGAEFQKKYSSYIWVSLAPGLGASATVTAESDRRPDYADKACSNTTTGLFDDVDFEDFSFETYSVPRVKRMKLKVKKFVYYKLIITSGGGEQIYVQRPDNDNGHGIVTVLNIDQRVRFGSDAKGG